MARSEPSRLDRSEKVLGRVDQALKALIALAQSRGWNREAFLCKTRQLWGYTEDVLQSRRLEEGARRAQGMLPCTHEYYWRYQGGHNEISYCTNCGFTKSAFDT